MYYICHVLQYVYLGIIMQYNCTCTTRYVVVHLHIPVPVPTWIKRGKTNSEISQKREPQKRCRRKECRYDIFHSTGAYYVWCIAVMVYAYKSTALFMFYQDCNAIRTIFYKVNLVGFFFFEFFFFFGLAKFVPKNWSFTKWQKIWFNLQQTLYHAYTFNLMYLTAILIEKRGLICDIYFEQWWLVPSIWPTSFENSLQKELQRKDHHM